MKPEISASFSQSLSRRLPELVAALILFLVIISLWLPFGFTNGFIGDGWSFYINARHGASWGALDRPFLPLAYVIGYALAPGSFAGFNWMLIILIFARSWLVYNILREFSLPPLFRFAVALVLAVFPADEGVFYAGALNVYLSWVAYLAAFYCLLRYWQRPHIITLTGMWIALILNLGIYEAAYPLILVSPLMVLLLKRKSWRIWRGVAFRWYLFPVLNVIRVFLTLLLVPQDFHYQSQLAARGPALLEMFDNLGFVYERHFFTAWFQHELLTSDWLIALGISVICLAACLGMLRYFQKNASRDFSSRDYLYLLLVGMAVVTLSMLVILPTLLSRETVRVYFMTSVGAALALVALLRLLLKNDRSFSVGISVVILLAFGQLLQQHRHDIAAANAEKQVVMDIMQIFPRLEPYSALVVIDESGTSGLETILWTRWHFHAPFYVLYDDPTLAIALCYPDDDPAVSTHYCEFEENAVTAHIGPFITWSRPYDMVHAVRYTAEREFVLADTLSYRP